jgi:hypothetical protein
MIGPIIGDFIFTKTGRYFPAFLFFGALLGIAGISNVILLPSSPKKESVVTNEEFEELEKTVVVKV